MDHGLKFWEYKPAQIAKALVAFFTSVVALLGLAAQVFADGPLEAVGGWAVLAASVLAPILVFVKGAEPIVSVYSSNYGRHEGTEGPA